MKIKMLVSIAGPNFVASPGDIVDHFTEAEAGRLIASGAAEAVKSAPTKSRTKRADKTEKAVLDTVETAAE